MLRRRPFVRASLTLAAIVGLLLPPGALRAEPSPEAARLESFAKADGDNYFSLSLRADIAGDDQPHDIVVLFDTSASQAGDYRVTAISALNALLAALGPEDRVQLLAVDINAVPLTKTFVSPQGEEMQAALAKLDKRVPLGTTDMIEALDAAAKCFGDQSRPHAAIYIGDGVSAGDVIDARDSQRIVNAFVDARVPLTSYGVGPKVDGSFLAALANQTGGVLALDGGNVTALQVGRFLAASAHEPVAWPRDVQWPESLAEIYPRVLPPLRGDRDTIVIGKGTAADGASVAVDAELAGKARKFQWNISAQPANVDNADLPAMVAMARVDGGISLPALGSEGLRQTRRMLAAASRQLSQLGGQAAAVGDFDQAKRLADAAQQLDPNNATVDGVHRLVAANDKDLRLVAQKGPKPRPAPAAAAGDDPLAQDGQLLENFDQQRQIMAQRLHAQVIEAINRSRALIGENPNGAIEELKVIQQNVQQAGELDAAQRTQLLGQVESAMREASRLRIVQEQQIISRSALQSQAAEEERITNELYLRDQKIEQLTARFSSLMAEERYVDAEQVAFIARDLQPEGVTPVAAVLTARTAGYYHESYQLREARHRGVVDMLATVERSHIPTPDEPPIVYPDPEVWQALTERRKHFAQVDLAQSGPAESRILSALEDQTDVEFTETPLDEIMAYLAERHRIPIHLDTKALEDAGASGQSNVTVNLRGIKLKSALKILLKELELTHVIQNEVLMITSKESADSSLKTKVYPVADLVLPIPRNTGGSSSGFGGQGGGLGGGGGGQGGGGGGFGGGGGGQGGGGGGGGFFNVPRPQGKFAPFAVPDELKLSKKKAAVVPSSQAISAPAAKADAQQIAAPAKSARKAQALRVKAKPGQSFDEVWNDFFATRKGKNIEPSDVRETVRGQIAAKDFDQSIALIQAALRHGQGQPWMFEALGLSLQATGRDKEELERTLLSAVDFSGSTIDKMYVAHYMANFGLDARALKLYQQVAKAEPNRPEPYVQGLEAASRIQSIPGIQWATVGILSQAWPNNQARIAEKALHKAKATIEQLNSEDRTAEAEAFQTALDYALQRDFVAIVRWSGDADVDLTVEEPSGTVCSLRNARTTGGGTLLGDALPASGESQEVYVCPQGFNGSYRLLVRRVWGKIPTGSVSVEICTNYGTPNAVWMRKQVELGQKDHLVSFDLESGRRQEPLDQQQLVNAAKEQVALGRDVMFRQLQAMSNSGSLRELAIARSDTAMARAIIGRRGAVGYMPVIIILPEGTQMTVRQAVISPDRRYVRVTPVPSFTAITRVDTFTFSGGLGGGQGGGQGGGGGGGGGGF